MTKEEAIIWCDRFNDAWANADQDGDFPDVKYSDKLDQLFYLAGKALRQQENKCPCDLCGYGPPSSMRGKPCTMCPAVPKEG